MARLSDSLLFVTPSCWLLLACAAPQAPVAEAVVIPSPASSASVAPPAAELAPGVTSSPTPLAPSSPDAESATVPAPLPDGSPAIPAVSRADAMEAIRLANDGDRSVKVNVEGAIQKYTSAFELDPTNAKIAHKLGQAYQKKEDWERMASTFAAAVALEPREAQYHFKRGYALVKLAEARDPDQYEAAKVPLERCIELEPTHAECHFFLGTAAEYTVDDQVALESYTRAIENAPEVAYFYPPLAALYIVHKRYREATRTLAEATRRIAPTEANAESLYAIHILRFQVAQVKGDDRAMLEAMEQAQAVVGDAHPEIAFHLGATYAALKPPETAKAIRLLMSFTKRVCRSSRAARYREQCQVAAQLLEQLGGR